MRKSRKLLATILAGVVMLSAGMFDGKQVEAETSITLLDSGIGYEERTDMASYYIGPESAGNVAPVTPGYVFGGWYKDEALTEVATEVISPAYAKWVPDYVLSVKAQIEVDKEDGLAEGETSYIRLISSVDDEYQDYGFRVIYNKKANVENRDYKYYLKDYKDAEGQTFSLYRTIKKVAGAEDSYEPAQVFGNASEYFFVAQIPNISVNNSVRPIYVKPFWVTPDGTEVEGLAKYVRVMDGYTANKYISVPVNLAADADIAAGIVTMTYPENLTPVTGEYGVDTGIGLPSIKYKIDTENRTITFVADTAPKAGEDGNIDPTEYTYVNVWFEGATVEEINSATDDQLSFAITAGDFCNWSEVDVDVTSRGMYLY